MNDEVLDIIDGYFLRIIYKTENYMVCKFETNEGPITVTGPSFNFEENQKYLLTGLYAEHPRYGFQFNIKCIDKYIPTKKDEIISFLSSKSFKGIGKKAAEKIYEYFGDNAINIIKDDISVIKELDLTEKQLLSLTEGFTNLKDPQLEIMFYLASNGFNSLESQKIYSRFELATIEVGNENPFRFYNDVYGISFNKVKNFANNVEFEDADNKYKEAFIIHLISEYTFNTGNIYIEENELLELLKKYGIFSDYNLIKQMAIDNDYIVYFDGKIYLYNDYNDELYIASFLKNFSSDMIIDDLIVESDIEENEKELGIKYDSLQKNAIKIFFNNEISIIVGGPGTGKTTIVKTMTSMFKKYYPYQNIIVVAPTGRAAKRINEICDVEAKTIHSLLKWNLETNTFVFDIDNPIMYDAIIIDEFSMVDNNLFASLLRACKNIKKICIIGDKNQLPSIRPGFVLNDLIESKRFITTHLISNYRQSMGNEIISLSNDIINGDINLTKYFKDIVFYDIKNENIDLISLIKEDIDNGYSLNDIQVLTPMYKGTWGIDNLNNKLQDAFNPKDVDKKEKKLQNRLFRENDKILQLKNRPVDDVYNGDIGFLEDIDEDEKVLLVNYNGIYCYYNFDELNDLSLAYAMSVHKSQGSEYQIVYLIISRSNLYMLNKKLLYTAVSRAKEKLVIICENSIFVSGASKTMKDRNTTLKDYLI